MVLPSARRHGARRRGFARTSFEPVRPAGARMRGVAIYAAFLAAVLALFLLLPQLDLLVSGLFYTRGRGFVLANWPPVIWVFDAVPWVAWGMVLVVAAAAIWLFLVGRPLWRFDRKALLFVAVSTALGP